MQGRDMSGSRYGSEVGDDLDWTRPLPPSGIQVLVDVAATFGVATETVLAGVGVTPEDLLDEQTVVTGLQEVVAVRNLQAALPRLEHLGLLTAQRKPITGVGSLGFAYMTAPDWLAPMQINRRFLPLTWSMCTFEMERMGDHYEFTFSPGSLPPDVAHYYLQRDMTAAVHLGRQNGAVEAVESAFPWAEPADAGVREEYRELFGVPPTFDAPEPRMRGSAAQLLSPQPLASPSAHARFLAEVEEELRQYRSMQGMRGRVRQQLQDHLEEGVSVEEVAATLHVSGRTLRRQLALEDTSFRDLLDEVRRSRAEVLLRNRDLSIGHISARLGYENAPAFTAACYRWYGFSPTEYRRQLG